MRKLRLEDLAVDSFATTAVAGVRHGTVEAHQDTWKRTCYSCEVLCETPPTVEVTRCELGCGDTLLESCGGTCGADTCAKTCGWSGTPDCEIQQTEGGDTCQLGCIG